MAAGSTLPAACYTRIAVDAAAHALGKQEQQMQLYRALAADPTQHHKHASLG